MARNLDFFTAYLIQFHLVLFVSIVENEAEGKLWAEVGVEKSFLLKFFCSSGRCFFVHVLYIIHFLAKNGKL